MVSSKELALIVHGAGGLVGRCGRRGRGSARVVGGVDEHHKRAPHLHRVGAFASARRVARTQLDSCCLQTPGVRRLDWRRGMLSLASIDLFHGF